ncbi:tumor necrosis factor receptor superfamily member 18-like isoform X2 [Chamaea fasciata]|uniref:tumor necrosis factor receptor superfamily member 18-like isoform X2 n=1 Tax=Chamaea fasciata TaxID=190680 RepID=UPI00336A3746
MRVPRPWLVLALLSLRWAGPGRAVPCRAGERRRLWGGDTKCCRPCPWKGENPSPCPEVSDHDCRCPEGSGCGDENCHVCLRQPECAPGWEPHRSGITHYQFECRRCGNGSYSSTKNSSCHKWTNCESGGFITLRAGNSTHNALCSLPLRALEAGGFLALRWGSSTVLAVLTAAAVFVLLLLTLLLHLGLWSLRREKKFPPADLGSNFPPRLILGEESRSIQFPEEEHGDKSAEEKLSVLSLKVYSELR